MLKENPFLKYLWVAYVKNEFDAGLPFQTIAELSYAVAVMDKIGGWEEGSQREDQNGARFGANMWISTKAVVCNGQRHMENFMTNRDYLSRSRTDTTKLHEATKKMHSLGDFAS